MQIRRFPLAARIVFSGIGKKADAADKGTITPFQALSTALASTVGNGNIGGVATAILIGGPGAIFWMWVCAGVGAATKYAEAVLGVHYRVTRESGELASGPMYYITRGIPNTALGKSLAIMFAFFGAAAALFGTGNMAQSNTVARTFVEASRSMLGIEVPLWVPGLLITVLVGSVLLGGIQRIAHVAEKLVPSMIVLYLGAGLTFLVLNITALPAALLLIITEAFSPTAAIGGFAGASVAQAIAAGVSRGRPVERSGSRQRPHRARHRPREAPGRAGRRRYFRGVHRHDRRLHDYRVRDSRIGTLDRSPLHQRQRRSHRGRHGHGHSRCAGHRAVCSFLFGFSTLIGWAYYGEKCIEFIFGSRVIVAYRLVFTALIMVGSVVSVPLVWAIGTLLNGFMAFPNLVGIFFLMGTVRSITSDYFDRGGREYSVAHPATGAPYKG